MFSIFSVLIGLRFYREKKRFGFLSFMSHSVVVGLALGVAALVIGLSIMNGFQRELQQRMLAIIPHIELQARSLSSSAWQALAQTLQERPEVARIQQKMVRDVLLEQGSQSAVVRLSGLDDKALTQLSPYLRAGWFQADHTQTLILTEAIAKRLGVNVGEQVSVVMVDTQSVVDYPSRIPTPTYYYFTVGAIVAFGSQLDQLMAFIPASQARALNFPLSGLMLTLTDVFAARTVADAYQQEFFLLDSVRTWMDDYGHLYQDIQLVRTLMIAVMLIVMVVACFNLLTSLILLINEKRAEIAILKTMGCTPLHLLMIFIMLGLFSGITGTFSGLILGVCIALALPHVLLMVERWSGQHFLDASVYFIDFVPTEIQWAQLFWICFIAVVFSVLATLHPAWRAITLKPAQELAHWQ